MDLRHYFSGYDPADQRLVTEISIPARRVGAVQQALGVQAWQIGAHYITPEQLLCVAVIAEVKLPKTYLRLDWFLDTYAREELPSE